MSLTDPVNPPLPPAGLAYRPSFSVVAYPVVLTSFGSTKVGPNVFKSTFGRGRPLTEVSDGWCFGDRHGYGCCYWYYRRGGALVSRYTLRKTPYGGIGAVVGINDRYGREYTGAQGGQTSCPGTEHAYEEEARPESVPDTGVYVDFPDGGSAGLFVAGQPENPAGWWKVSPDEQAETTVTAEGYLGEALVLTLTVERDPDLTTGFTVS